MIKSNHIQDFQNFLIENAEIQIAFENASKTRKIPKGSLIVGQNDEDRDMFLLREGGAKVVIYSRGGHEVQLAELSGGTLFGEMAVLRGANRSSNVVAKSDCTLGVISAKDFQALMHRFPQLAIYMTQMLAQRLQQTSQNLFESHAFSVPQRLYAELLRRSQQRPTSPEVYRLNPAPAVTSLSEGLNVSREATSRALTKLISRGLVSKDKSYWDILRPDFDEV